MLEIRRGKAVRHYENSFFREFAKNLKNMFDKYNLDGLLIANPECTVDERLQIDTLLITKHVVCIIDFKNFGGKIILPTEDDFFNGIWTNENGERIKGGSSINPYKQLHIQKKKFQNNKDKKIVGIYEKFIKDNIAEGDSFEPRHILKMVCFQKNITLEGEIPSRNQIDFFITSKENYLEQIKDIIDITSNDINLSKASYMAFKEIFQANKFDLEEKYEEKIELQKVVNEENKILYRDQELALKEINNFLSSDEKIFILNGSVNSGKSYLIKYIEELAYKNKFQEIKNLVQSKRIANNLSDENINFDSIYSYIYGGQKINNEEIKIVPLKQNNDEEECLYIVDEAQLITDSYYKSIDLQFGSGYLLKDLLEFIELKDSKRKVIFIGDPYQLVIGSKEKTSLNFDYIKTQYKYEIKSFYLVDKPSYSYNTKEALKCVDAIKSKKYNLLQLDLSNTIQELQKDKLKDYVNDNIDNDFKILVYSNENAKKVNLWIKKSIIKNGEDIAKNDLVLFNNNIEIKNPNDPFAQSQSIFNGEFAKVFSVSSNIISELILLKQNKQIRLNFRELQVQLKSNNEIVSILSFENFRLNTKNELSDDEVVAYKILLKRIIKEDFLKSQEFKRVQNKVRDLKEEKYFEQLLKDGRSKVNNDNQKYIKNIYRDSKKEFEKRFQSQKYFQYKNSAWLKFGWAMTMHKAISYKFDEVLINADQGENRGKTNENYFRWFYSGLTRANKNIKLINYKPINPLSKISINIVQKEHKKFFFIGDLEEFENFIKAKIINESIEISNINHHNYQEQYIFSETQNNNSATIVIYYNGKKQFKKPKLASASNEEFGKKIISLLKADNYITDFNFITNGFKKVYINLNEKLNKENIYFSYIIQKKYIDEVKFVSNQNSVTVEFNYNGDGFFTKVNIFDNNNSNLAKNIKDILENL